MATTKANDGRAITMNENLKMTQATAGAGVHENEAAVTGVASADTREELSESPESATEKAEFGGPKGLEPTRYGDWERNGRCYDF
jgi:hypothetical protein